MNLTKRNLNYESLKSIFNYSRFISLFEITSFDHFVQENKVTLNWKSNISLKGSKIYLEKKCVEGINHHDWKQIAFINDDEGMYEASKFYFYDIGLEDGKYYYRIKRVNDFGETFFYELSAPVVIITESAKQEIFKTPEEFYSLYHYPCPISSMMIIKFILPKPAIVNLILVEDTSRDLTVIVSKYLKAGAYRVNTNVKISDLKTGLYSYELEANGQAEIKEMKFENDYEEIIEPDSSIKTEELRFDPLHDLKFA